MRVISCSHFYETLSNLRGTTAAANIAYKFDLKLCFLQNLSNVDWKSTAAPTRTFLSGCSRPRNSWRAGARSLKGWTRSKSSSGPTRSTWHTSRRIRRPWEKSSSPEKTFSPKGEVLNNPETWFGLQTLKKSLPSTQNWGEISQTQLSPISETKNNGTNW